MAAKKTGATSRLRAPYDIMCKVIGHPVHRPASGERVAWDVDVDGARVRIADHKDDHPVGSNIFEAKHTIWHVSADDDERLTWACARLAERVIEAVAKQQGARTLTAEDKVALNGLIKAGVPLAEAMKRVRMQVVDGDARYLYQWPMKDIPLVLGDASVRTLVALAADSEAASTSKATGATANTTTSAPAAAKKVPIGPPIPSDMPRSSIDAPYTKLVALFGEPEDKPIPFVSTRWRFVLDEKRADGKQIVRHEDEPSDDPRDIDACVFDRISRFDEPYGARTAPTHAWTIISTSTDNIDRVLAWLDDHLK